MNNIMSSQKDDVFRYIMRPFTGNETVSVELPLTQWQQLSQALLAGLKQCCFVAIRDKQKDSYFAPYSQRDYEIVKLMEKRFSLALHLSVEDQISSEANSALFIDPDYDEEYRSILDKCKEQEEQYRSDHDLPF